MNRWSGKNALWMLLYAILYAAVSAVVCFTGAIHPILFVCYQITAGILLSGIVIMGFSRIKAPGAAVCFSLAMILQDRVIQLGVTTREAIRRRGVRFRSLCLPAYIVYVLVCVYAINGARGFLPGFWQGFVILSIMNLIDRLLIDEYWVGHTHAWVIPGTEDLRPYITTKDKRQKWIMGTIGMAVLAAVLAGIMAVIL